MQKGLLTINQVVDLVNYETKRNLTVVDIHGYAGKPKGWLKVAHKPGPPKPNGYALEDVNDFVDRLNALTIEAVKAEMSERLDGRSITWEHINRAANADVDNLFHVGTPPRFPHDALWLLEAQLRGQLGIGETE